MINYSRRGMRQRQSLKALQVRDMQKGQFTEVDSDKIEFDRFRKAKNLISVDGNFETRKGVKILAEPAGLYGMALYSRDTGNFLYAYRKDGATTSKLTQIDRSTGTLTDRLITIAGQGNISHGSMNGWLYFCNGGGAITKYENATPTAGTLALPSGNAKLLGIAAGRIWACNDSAPQNVLYFSEYKSSGTVTTFATGTTTIERSGVANTEISDIKALLGCGRYMVVFGANQIEIHSALDPNTSGMETYPLDMNTLVQSIPNNGVISQYAVVSVDNQNVYFKGKGGSLYQLSVPYGKLKKISSNYRVMEEYQWDTAALGYDQNKSLIYIAGKETVTNNIIFPYSLKYDREENFSEFPDLFATQFVSDESDVYYCNNGDNKIYLAFNEDQYTDEHSTGIQTEINCEIRSAATYEGTNEMYKWAESIYMNVFIKEETTFYYDFYANVHINDLSINPDKTIEITVTNNAVASFILGVPPFGLSPFGLLPGEGDFSTDGIEYEEHNARIALSYLRAEVGLRWSSTNPCKLRGIGFTSKNTNRKNYNLTYK